MLTLHLTMGSIPKFTKEELETLDSWRGFLSIVVFLAHTIQIFVYPLIGTDNYLVVANATMANISVICFFILSGVLISYSGLNLTKDNSFNWKKYLANRITRIYPAFIVVLVISLVMVKAFPYLNEGTFSIKKLATDKYIARESFLVPTTDFLKSLLMIKSGVLSINGPLWSLILECLLYLTGLFLLLILASAKKISFKNLIFFAAAIFTLKYNYDFLGISSVYYALIWLLGFAFTLFFREQTKLLRIVLLISFGIVCISVARFGLSAVNIINSKPIIFGAFQVFCALFFLNVMLKPQKLLSYFRPVAAYSYTLYILHFPVLLFIFANTRGTISNPVYFTIIATMLTVPFILMLSNVISKFAENKNAHRRILSRLTDKIFLTDSAIDIKKNNL